MYESFFRFHDRPFIAAPLVENYYPAEGIEHARQVLIRIIERAEGPGLVVGPAGVGKSLLCRLLAEYFRDRFDVVLLSSTRIGTRKVLLQNILFELGLPYRELAEGDLASIGRPDHVGAFAIGPGIERRPCSGFEVDHPELQVRLHRNGAAAVW